MATDPWIYVERTHIEVEDIDYTIRIRPPDAEVEQYVEHVDQRMTAANEYYATRILPHRQAEQEQRNREAADRQRRLEEARRRIDAAQARIDDAAGQTGEPEPWAR